MIFEHDNAGGFMHGFTSNYIKVKHPYNAGLCNQPTLVKLGMPDAEGSMTCTVSDPGPGDLKTSQPALAGL
jgi:threonylcarbamoyladenosine tRNA methylthiotransferase MtaB